MTTPKATHDFTPGGLDAALEFLKRTRNELRAVRFVHVWKDRFRIIDVNHDCFEVRGVGLSKGTLDLLFEQNWIRPMGRRRVPGRPVTWGTTDFFLEHFGLPTLDDLPGHEEMKAAGLLDPRAQAPIFRPEEPDLPLEAEEDEADEPLATEEQSR